MKSLPLRVSSANRRLALSLVERHDPLAAIGLLLGMREFIDLRIGMGAVASQGERVQRKVVPLPCLTILCECSTQEMAAEIPASIAGIEMRADLLAYTV